MHFDVKIFFFYACVLLFRYLHQIQLSLIPSSQSHSIHSSLHTSSKCFVPASPSPSIIDLPLTSDMPTSSNNNPSDEHGLPPRKRPRLEERLFEFKEQSCVEPCRWAELVVVTELPILRAEYYREFRLLVSWRGSEEDCAGMPPVASK